MLFLNLNMCLSQKVNRQVIDSSFRKIDSTFKQKRGVLYVLNGILYDSLQLDIELSKYDLKSLIELSYVTCEKSGLFHCSNDAAIMLFAYDQKVKFKRKNWQKAKHILADNNNVVTLLIDNVPVSEDLIKQTFKDLRLKDILYIDTAQLNGKQQIRIFKAKSR